MLLLVLVLQKRYAQANSLLDLSLGTATMSIPVKVLKVRERPAAACEARWKEDSSENKAVQMSYVRHL